MFGWLFSDRGHYLFLPISSGLYDNGRLPSFNLLKFTFDETTVFKLWIQLVNATQALNLYAFPPLLASANGQKRTQSELLPH